MCDHLGTRNGHAPALLAADGDDSYTHACIEAYRRWCAGAGALPREVRVGRTEEDAAEQVTALLRAPDRPGAVFGLEDLHLQVLRSAVRRCRLRVPTDVALGCFTEETATDEGSGPVARLTGNPAALAGNAVALLVDRIENRDPRPELRTVDCALRV
nr:substrate-binding domain-containing protein [Pseudonocardia sp. C8]